MSSSQRDEPSDVHLLGQERHDSTIHLASYDLAWPDLFAWEAARVRSQLGDRVIRLEHIGSTSVPELSAKPIIDVPLVVEDPADEPAYVPLLEAEGYVLEVRDADWYEHRMLKGPDTDVNLHVHAPTSPEVERSLIFRDWLRTHDGEHDLYERTKHRPAARRWRYVQDYADAKSEVVEQILRRAQDEPTDSGEHE